MKKRIFITILILMFSFVISYSQSLYLKSPKRGDVWYKGHTYTITWTKRGKLNPNVKITLYKPDRTTLQLIIAKPTLNDGSYSWKVPNSIPSGQYIIRIKTMDNTVFAESEVFTIKFRFEMAKRNIPSQLTLLKTPLQIKSPDLAIVKTSLTIYRDFKWSHNIRYIRIEFKGLIQNVGTKDYVDNSGNPCIFLYLSTMWMDYPEKDFRMSSLKVHERKILTHTIWYPVDGFVINGERFYKGVLLRIDTNKEINKTNNYKEFYVNEVKTFIEDFLNSTANVKTINK